VTAEGGGSSSDCLSRRIVTSSKMAIAAWISSETRIAKRNRHGR
jgi:hypothetical protein